MDSLLNRYHSPSSASLDERAATRDAQSRTFLVLAATLLAAGYLASVAWKGWIPFDDGMLAQTAQRVLDGQLPHRDFTDVYTGGLSFFHALAFRVGGSSLGTLRATLLVTSTASLPVWYYVASRFTPPPMAALVAVTAFVWSVPNYPAAMPSWYNLILAICAAAATLRFFERHDRRWLFVAGLCTGLSILVKIIGLYLLAGLASVIAYRVVETTGETGTRAVSASRIGTVAAIIAVALLAVAPFVLVEAAIDSRAVLELALPVFLLVAAIEVRMLRAFARGWRLSLRWFTTTYWPFALGVGIPVVLFALMYLSHGALPALVRGVFVLPSLRFAEPNMRTAGGPPLATVLFAIPLILLLTLRSSPGARRRQRVLLGVIMAILVALSVSQHRVMVSVWLSVRMLTLPIATIVGARLARPPNGPVGAQPASPALVLVTSLAVWCSLTQFPYGAPIYFSYVAPLVVFAAVALTRELRRAAPSTGVLLLVGYAAFAVAVRPQLFPRSPELSPTAQRLDLARGGIYVWPSEQRQYTEVVELLRQHAASKRILALPDVPEVYFLSAYKNPTRAIYDVFDNSPNRDKQLLQIIGDSGIRAVVINRDPQLSRPISATLDTSLRRLFPISRTVGALDVRWQ